MDEKEAGGGGGGIRRVTKVLAKRVTKTKEVEAVRLTFKREGVIGKGSFGVVQLVRLQRVSPVEGNGEGSSCIKPTRLAMKTVVVKQRESRELGILKQLAHPNIVPLRYFFFSNAKAGPGITLNLLFDAQPTTVYDALEELAGRGDVWSSEEVAQYGSQLAAGLSSLSSLMMSIDCHQRRPGDHISMTRRGLPALPVHRTQGHQAQKPTSQAGDLIAIIISSSSSS